MATPAASTIVAAAGQQLADAGLGDDHPAAASGGAVAGGPRGDRELLEVDQHLVGYVDGVRRHRAGGEQRTAPPARPTRPGGRSRPAASAPVTRKTPMPEAIQTFCTSRLDGTGRAGRTGSGRRAPGRRCRQAAAAGRRRAARRRRTRPRRRRPGPRRRAAAAYRAGRYDAAHGGEQPAARSWPVAGSRRRRRRARRRGRPSTAATAHQSAAPIPADLVAGALVRAGRGTAGPGRAADRRSRPARPPRLDADRLEADRLREQPAGGRDQLGRVRQPAVRGVLTGHVGDRGAHRDEEVERAGGYRARSRRSCPWSRIPSRRPPSAAGTRA